MSGPGQESVRKRRRCDEEDEAGQSGGPTSSLKRDPQFWYEDGTVVLVAQNVKFGVYKGILADHSPVFADMFSLPQPPPGSPASKQSSHDVPVVHLTDSPEDLRHILEALMPRKKATFLRSHPSFDIISAYARLGHKYQIEDLVEQSLEYLKEWYTNDFDIWDSHLKNIPPGFASHHAIGVVNIARLTGCDIILPTALSTCCFDLSGDEIVQGYLRQDGSRELLSTKDLARCFTARLRLAQASVSAVLSAFTPCQALLKCPTHSTCKKGVSALLHDPRFDFIEDADPFNLVYYVVPSGDSPCKACIDHLRGRLLEEQRKIWMNLPELVGVEVAGWEAGEAT